MFMEIVLGSLSVIPRDSLQSDKVRSDQTWYAIFHCGEPSFIDAAITDPPPPPSPDPHHSDFLRGETREGEVFLCSYVDVDMAVGQEVHYPSSNLF